MMLLLEIKDLKEKLEYYSKIVDDRTSMLESQVNLLKNKDTTISGYENTINENSIKYKKLVEKVKTLTNERDSFFKEKSILDELLLSVLSRKKEKEKEKKYK